MDPSKEPTKVPSSSPPADTTQGLFGLVTAALDEALLNEAYTQRDALRAYLAPIVASHVRRFFRDNTPTAEHLQDVALDRTIRNLHQCRSRSDGGIYRWVLRITQNVALDEIRRLKPPRQPLRNYPDSLSGIEHSVLLTSYLSAVEPSHGQVILGEILRRVSEKHEQTLEMLSLKQEERETWGQIGALFGISGGAAKERVRRALAAMRTDVLNEIQHLAPSDKVAVREYLAFTRIPL